MTDPVAQATELWAEGRRLNDLGRFADAARTLGSARTLVAPLGDASARRIGIRVDITAALTHLELEGYAVAAQMLSLAARRASDLEAGDLVALSHIQHGVIDARSGRWAEASSQLRQVLPLFEHLGPVEQCSTLITLGLAELSLRRLEDAEAALDRARALARDHELPVHLFKATHNLGCAAYVAGDLPRALRLMDEADSMPIEVARERAQLDLATVLLEAGLLDRARESLTAALDTARSTGQRLDDGDILLDLARCALLDDDPDLARRLAAAAGATFGRHQAAARQEAAELFIAGVDAAAGVRLAEALEVAGQWHEQGSLEGLDAALVRAEAHLAQDDRAACVADLDQVAAAQHPLLSRRLHELHVRTRLADRVDDREAFSSSAHAASELTAATQGAMRSLEVRAALAQHAVPIARLDLARALAEGSPRDVFATIERWRAASRRALLPAAQEHPTQRELVAELRWLRAGIAPVPGQDPEHARRIAELERAISAAGWQQAPADPARAAAPISLGDLQARLQPGTVFVAFTETARRCHALLVSDTSERIVPLAATADLTRAVASLRRDLRGAAHAFARPALWEVLAGAVTASARALDELILGPLRADLLDQDRLVLAPSALLQAVPWSALPGIGHRPVTVAQSATTWTRGSTAAPVPAATVGTVIGPWVANAAAEVEGVAAIWHRGQVATTGQPGPATAAEAAAVLAGADIVHVAAHGRHAEHSPLFSSLSMSDGPLFAHELATVRARHVVLSACDVGRSRVRAGGETLGLTAALLALGVQSVIAAVAPVPHEVASHAALAYHEALAAGLDAAAALARAVAATPGAESWCAFGAEFAVRAAQQAPAVSQSP